MTINPQTLLVNDAPVSEDNPVPCVEITLGPTSIVTEVNPVSWCIEGFEISILHPLPITV